MPGRKPTPTALKLVRGNPGHRPIRDDEPVPKGEAVMPEWLSPEAARHWPKVAQLLQDAGLLTSVDAAALALYCESFARWHHANQQVAKFGPVVKTPNGFPVQSPFLGIANKAQEQMTRLLVEFGMTPSSRTKVTKAPSDEGDEFSGFVKNRKRP